MIFSISNLEPRAAAGVLARAAMALTDQGNPASEPVIEDELRVRVALLSEVRHQLGFSATDDSPQTIEQLADFLDDESDKLIGPTDTDAALKRLAESGDLPPDLYEIRFDAIRFDQLVEDVHLERRLAETTIHFPQKEQHYGRSVSQHEPSLASLFLRRFHTKWPFKDFSMLVVAQRDGLTLRVIQAWRLYDSAVNTRAATDLVGILQAFAGTYGREIEANGRKGQFFLTSDEPLPPIYRVGLREGTQSINITQIVGLRGQGGPRAALVVSVDLDKYRQTIKKMEVLPEEILDEALHDAPALKPNS